MALSAMACSTRYAPIASDGQAHRGRLQGEAPSVSAQAIVRSYLANPTRADERYNDRTWVVEGFRVDRIRNDAAWMDHDAFSVRLTFADRGDVFRLHVGSLATARCDGDGLRDQDVRFEDCRLVRVEDGVIGAAEEPSAEDEDDDDRPRKKRARDDDDEGGDDDDDDRPAKKRAREHDDDERDDDDDRPMKRRARDDDDDDDEGDDGDD